MKWIVGLNGAGKTIYLDNQIDAYAKKGTVITNLREVHYKGFDEQRIDLIKCMNNYDIMTNYGELKVIGNELVIDTEDFQYTEDFIKILNLLCRKGEYIIIDEPEFNLYGIEVNFLVDILNSLVQTYKDGIIATHCQSLFCIEPNNFYWCKGYKLIKIGEEQLHECIGKF